MKQLIILISITFIFIACGTETKKITQDPAYNYVEIEECSIPVLKKMKRLKDDIGTLYRFAYHNNGIDDYLMNFLKITGEDDIFLRESIVQNKNTQLISESKRKHFKILKWSIIDSVLDNAYYLIGPKTKIYISQSNDTKINQILDYCNQTWKLNKGENNASTSK